jgi:hypothetical protein
MLCKCDILVSTEFGVPVMQKHEQPFLFTFKERINFETGKCGIVISFIFIILGARKRKLEDDSVKELWCINWPRLTRNLINELVFKLIRNHKDYEEIDEHFWRSFLYTAEAHTKTSGAWKSAEFSVIFKCLFSTQQFRLKWFALLCETYIRSK